MKSTLFNPAPVRKTRVVLTLVGSVLFHGALIGVAALWPYHPVKAGKPIITILLPPPDDSQPPASNDPPVSTPLPGSDPVTPPPAVTPDLVADDTPPPPLDPDIIDPTRLPEPTPRQPVTAPAVARSTSHASSNRAPSSNPSGRAAGTSGFSGLTRSGTTGRWNVSSTPPIRNRYDPPMSKGTAPSKLRRTPPVGSSMPA